MISPTAIREFLDRPLRDSAKAKRFTTGALNRKLETIDGVSFVTDPRKHQKVCFLLGVKRKVYLFLLDCGLGKTKLVLDLIAYLKNIGAIERGLVLVPNATNIQSWLNQIKIHQPHLRGIGVVGDREQRQEVMDSDADLVICTYMGWLALTCVKIQVKTKSGTKTKMVPEPKLLKLLCKRFGLVAYDESSFLQNHQSTTAKCCKPFLKWTPYRYALTGTPFGRDPHALWSQFYLVDGGETLGETLGLFRGAFFTEKPNYWGGRDYVFQSSKQKRLNRMLRHGSIRYSEDECLDLPGRVYTRRPVVWPKEAWGYYQKLLKDLVASADDPEQRGNLYHRMRQLCSGYVSATGQHDEKIEIVFADNPKLDALVDALKYEIRPDRKMIVFHLYKMTGQLIADRLKTEGIKHTRLWSGTKQKERETLEHRFASDPKLRVLVSSTAGAYGLNLQPANYIWMFESPSDPKLRKQEEARAYRQGQTRTVFVVDSFVKNSLEAKVLRYLAEGKDLFQAVVEGQMKGLM